MDATTSRRPVPARVIISFMAVVITAAISAIRDIVPDLPRNAVIIAALITMVITVWTGYLEFRAARHPDPASPSSTPSTSSRPTRVGPVWLGITLVFTLLTLAQPVFAPVAIFAGLIAFRRRRMAAGVGLALATILLAGAGLLYAAEGGGTSEADEDARLDRTGASVAPLQGRIETEPETRPQTEPEPETETLTRYLTSLQQRCADVEADADACLALAAGQPDLILAAYGYPECRQVGGSPAVCVQRLP